MKENFNKEEETFEVAPSLCPALIAFHSNTVNLARRVSQFAARPTFSRGFTQLYLIIIYLRV